MRKRAMSLALILLSLASSGCATIVSGTTQKMDVTSKPSGALAVVDGKLSGTTPTTFTLERKSDHTIEISKDGYRTQTVILRRVFNEMMTGNILIGGLVGSGVDAVSGSMYKLTPERVDVVLEKDDGSGFASAFPAQQGVKPEVKESVKSEALAAAPRQEPVKTQRGANFGPKKQIY
jgi:hypothetical protein